jgi:hypothetical protein
MKRKSSRFSDLTTVYTAAGLIKAQVIKAKLEAAGIRALLDYESVGPVIGITVDGLGEVRVLVSTEDAEEARDLIEEES